MKGEGYRVVLSLGTVRRFFLGLPEVNVCVFPGLLFSSLYASFRWFLLGCPCVPYWTGSSPVGDGENTSRCARELVHNSGAGGDIFVWGGWGECECRNTVLAYLGFSLSVSLKYSDTQT